MTVSQQSKSAPPLQFPEGNIDSDMGNQRVTARVGNRPPIECGATPR